MYKGYNVQINVSTEQERLQEDPAERLHRENRQLLAANLRLEHENDDLALELVNSKIQMQRQLDVVSHFDCFADD